MPIQTLNPATGEIVRTFNALTPKEINDKLDVAHRTAQSWRRAPIRERLDVLRRAGELRLALLP
jgi:succinate-semialdehyde dehydrogenase/glutarate-semialdehyde dehydrogenase